MQSIEFSVSEFFTFFTLTSRASGHIVGKQPFDEENEKNLLSLLFRKNLQYSKDNYLTFFASL